MTSSSRTRHFSFALCNVGHLCSINMTYEVGLYSRDELRANVRCNGFRVTIPMDAIPTDTKIFDFNPNPNHSSRKRMKHGKKRKKSRFLDFEKNVKKRKNVEA